MKYSKVEGVISWSGGSMPLRKGTRFDDDHQLVAERPELFDNVDPGADHKATPVVGSVERATAAPGEVRVTPGTGPQQRGNRIPRTGSGQ
jgi:hypothetical protein